MRDVHPVIIEKSDLPALRLPSRQQLEWGELEFSMSACSVTVRTCEKVTLVQDVHTLWFHFVKMGVISLQKMSH